MTAAVTVVRQAQTRGQETRTLLHPTLLPAQAACWISPPRHALTQHHRAHFCRIEMDSKTENCLWGGLPAGEYTEDRGAVQVERRDHQSANTQRSDTGRLC